jgi:1-acyl-sn-glycerol-3-phosphate acyltransferase
MRRLIAWCVHFFCYLLATMLLLLLFPVRMSGLRRTPKHGPILIVANHQSFLDPLLIGLTMGESLRYVARLTLFRFGPFRWLIDTLGAIPIDQEGIGKGGLRQSVDALNAGDRVVLFPEGTRTYTGRLSPIQPGVLLLLRRTEAPVVVVAISGAFQSYPIFRRFPIPLPIWVEYVRWNPVAKRGSRESLRELEELFAVTFERVERRRRRFQRNHWTYALRNPPREH